MGWNRVGKIRKDGDCIGVGVGDDVVGPDMCMYVEGMYVCNHYFHSLYDAVRPMALLAL